MDKPTKCDACMHNEDPEQCAQHPDYCTCVLEQEETAFTNADADTDAQVEKEHTIDVKK